MKRTLRVCFVCKYPPIEGGVSKEAYWLTRGLAERGHHVHVVTNAFEVEECYRMYLEADDLDLIQVGSPGDGRGRLVVSNSSPYTTNPRFIPEARPYVSKLAGMAIDEVETEDLDVVYSYYLEPYGVAGHLCSTLMGVPHVMRHSGSDFYKLSTVAPLGKLYQQVWRQAAAIIATPDSAATMQKWGVSPERFFRSGGAFLPRSHFHPQVDPLDVNAFFDRMRSVNDRYLDSALMSAGEFNPETPTVGIYGKAAQSKGTFDLVAALSLLKDRGVAFNFLAMIGGAQADAVKSEIRRSGLDKQSWVLPFLPHWKVPSFIRACTTVCFLERGFWLAHHTPSVPAEVLACGVCLILSGEAKNRPSTRPGFRSGSNVVLVEDPTNPKALASKLLETLESPERAAAIGRRGFELGSQWDDGDRILDHHEDLLSRVVEGASFA